MRTRLLLGTVAAALAATVAAPAHAVPTLQCAEGFEIVCTVLGLTCVKENPCHP